MTGSIAQWNGMLLTCHKTIYIYRLKNTRSACSVAASYKPPMLVTRVRLPACADLCIASLLNQLYDILSCSQKSTARLQCRWQSHQTGHASARHRRAERLWCGGQHSGLPTLRPEFGSRRAHFLGMSGSSASAQKMSFGPSCFAPKCWRSAVDLPGGQEAAAGKTPRNAKKTLGRFDFFPCFFLVFFVPSWSSGLRRLSGQTL